MSRVRAADSGLPTTGAGEKGRGPRLSLAGAQLLVGALVFCSGAVALVFELLWVRSFATLFGASAPALAATVSGVFAGMAVGSAFFGRGAERWKNPQRAWGLLQIGAGLGGVAVLAVLPAYRRFAPTLLELVGAQSPLALLHALLVLLAVFPCSFLLGGTLPLSARVLEVRAHTDAATPGRLYAANLLGSVLGALALPFWLLPAFSTTECSWLAASASIGVGVLAWRCVPQRTLVRSERHRQRDDMGARPALPRALACAAGVLGMGLEILWARMLAQVHQGTLHAFGVVLALFLLALALGAWLAAAALQQRRDPWRLLEASWIAAGLSTLAAPLVFSLATCGLDYLSAASGAGYLEKLAFLGALTFVIPSACAGAALPILFALAPFDASSRAPAIGRLLAANTAGAIAGPLLATFAFFPLLGMWGTAVLLGACYVGLSSATRGARGAPRRSPARRCAPWLAVGALGFAAASLPRVHLDRSAGEELAWIDEGSHGIVSVVRSEVGLRLKLDNFYTLGGNRSVGDDCALGHIPLLLHAAPRRVAFLGLGTGITASAALSHPVEEIQVFELVPEVATAAREVFAPYNSALLDDPRVRLVRDDARSRLRAQRGALDVIVGDLVVPWRRGEAALHTREHFEGVRAALAPDGLFCQWLPLFQMSEEEVRIVAATFLDVFGSASLWRGEFVASSPTLGLIARADGRPLDPAIADRNVQQLADALSADQRYLVHPAGLWMHLIGELGARTSWLASTRRNTDARPWLELSSAQNHASGRARTGSLLVGDVLLHFLAGFGPPEPDGPLAALDSEHARWRSLGADLYRASCLAEAGAEEQAHALALATLQQLPPRIQVSVMQAAGREK